MSHFYLHHSFLFVGFFLILIVTLGGAYNHSFLYIRATVKKIHLFSQFLTMKLLLLFLCTLTVSSAVDRVVLPDTDREYLTEMLITYEDKTEDEAKKLIDELENFYTGLRDKILDCGPPGEIDKAYHWHILETRAYAAFTQKTFGTFIHHTPHWAGSPPSDDEQVRCANPVLLLKSHGINVQNENLWETPQQCGGKKKRMMFVESRSSGSHMARRTMCKVAPEYNKDKHKWL